MNSNQVNQEASQTEAPTHTAIHALLERVVRGERITAEEALVLGGTKTERAACLFGVGCTRRQVADLVLGGNYGWAQNLFARWYPDQVKPKTPRDPNAPKPVKAPKPVAPKVVESKAGRLLGLGWAVSLQVAGDRRKVVDLLEALGLEMGEPRQGGIKVTQNKETGIVTISLPPYRGLGGKGVYDRIVETLTAAKGIKFAGLYPQVTTYRIEEVSIDRIKGIIALAADAKWHQDNPKVLPLNHAYPDLIERVCKADSVAEIASLLASTAKSPLAIANGRLEVRSTEVGFKGIEKTDALLSAAL